jgi:hypothetical protein
MRAAVTSVKAARHVALRRPERDHAELLTGRCNITTERGPRSITPGLRRLGFMDDQSRAARQRQAHDNALTHAIDALRDASVKRRLLDEGTPEHEAAVTEEQRLNALVLELARRRARSELGTG